MTLVLAVDYDSLPETAHFLPRPLAQVVEAIEAGVSLGVKANGSGGHRSGN